LTVRSPPGETNARGEQKRAWLSGFCDEDTLNQILDGLEDSGLMLLQGYRSTREKFCEYPTVRDSTGQPDRNQTFFSLQNEDDIRNQFPHLLELPFKCNHLTIFDREWCRNTLWSKLASALRCKVQEDHGRWYCVVCGSSFSKSGYAWHHDLESCTL
jgi:hypothetical protein